MTKAELVEEVARAAELNKRDAEVIVETVFDSIISTLHKGEKVELRGFGSFRTRERGPRRGRNPKTGEPVDVPAKRVPYFKPGKELKEFFTDSPDDDSAEGEESETEAQEQHVAAAAAEPTSAEHNSSTPAPAATESHEAATDSHATAGASTSPAESTSGGETSSEGSGSAGSAG